MTYSNCTFLPPPKISPSFCHFPLPTATTRTQYIALARSRVTLHLSLSLSLSRVINSILQPGRAIKILHANKSSQGAAAHTRTSCARPRSFLESSLARGRIIYSAQTRKRVSVCICVCVRMKKGIKSGRGPKRKKMYRAN